MSGYSVDLVMDGLRSKKPSFVGLKVTVVGILWIGV